MDEQDILEGLKRHNIHAYKALVLNYAEDMTVMAASLLKDDRKQAIKIVDSILESLFNDASRLTLPLDQYLTKEIQKACNSVQ